MVNSPTGCGLKKALLASLLCLCLLSGRAWAENELNALRLDPATTLVALLDDGTEPVSADTRRIFSSAGFKVARLASCSSGEEQNCLQRSLLDLKERHDRENILLATSSRHSQTVHSVYQIERTGALLSGIILFRANRTIPEGPVRKTPWGPPLLVIAEETDDPDTITASRRFADHMRLADVWSWFALLPGQSNPKKNRTLMAKAILYFAGALPKEDKLYELLRGHAHWQHPPLDNNEFFSRVKSIKTYRADKRFRSDMNRSFDFSRAQLHQWKLDRYQGIDLLALRDAKPETRGMRYLLLRNLRGQFAALDIEAYAEYEPVIVVGIDYETNLYRINAFYRLKKKYSWKADEAPIALSVNPLGAFLHFRKPLPGKLRLPLSIRSMLRYDGISFSDENPLADLKKLPPAVYKTVRRNCILCHSLDGLGGKAHHLTAATGEPQGGFALPLRSYPEKVLKQFFFDQDKAAETIGVRPNRLPAANARALHEFLTAGK